VKVTVKSARTAQVAWRVASMLVRFEVVNDDPSGDMMFLMSFDLHSEPAIAVCKQ
jgi:hypothetical protein